MITIFKLLLTKWALNIPKWILGSVTRASIFFFALGYLLGNGYVKGFDSLVALMVSEVQKLLP